MDDISRNTEPADRLGRLAAAAMAAVEEHEEAAGTERVIVMMMDQGRGMVAVDGYQSETPELEAAIDLFLHLAAMFGAQGKTLQLMNEDGVIVL